MLEELSVIENVSISEIRHFFSLYANKGLVVLQYQIAYPETGDMRDVANVPLPPEKARALGELLIRYAGYAEK